MGNLFKAMMMGYLLPLFMAGMVVFIPDFDGQYMKWIVLIFIILFGMPIVLTIRFPKKKKKAYKLTMKYQLYAFIFFFTFPLLKVLKGNIIFQLLLIGLFIGIYFLARFDQRTEVPIVFPGVDKKIKKIAYIYYAIPVLLTVLSLGGGDYVVINRAFLNYGAAFMVPYIAIILYLWSCWLFFFFCSFAYKSHVKEGYLEK